MSSEEISSLYQSGSFSNQSCFFPKDWQMANNKEQLLFNELISAAYQALISTSTPEGRSNLLNASTVLDEDV